MRVRSLLRPFLVMLRNKTNVLFSDKNLLYTNMGISVGISVMGDSVQQIYQISKSDKPWKWDFQRSLQMAGSGFITGPFVHYWYFFLDRFFPGKSLRTVMIKLSLDQFVCSPIYIALFLIATGIIERQTWEEFKQECRDKVRGLIYIEFLVWPPAQFVNFFFLPAQYRVLFDNIFSLLVDALYSYVRFDYKVESDGENKKTDINNELDEVSVKSLDEKMNENVKVKEISASATHSDISALSDNESKLKGNYKYADSLFVPRSPCCRISDNFHSSCIILDS